MVIGAIGDIHGKNIWKNIDFAKFDKFIFLGDYFDNYEDTTNDLNNFLDIITLKKQFPDKIVLLLGNHDYHYLVDNQRYSGFQSTKYFSYNIELKQAVNERLLQICYHHQGFLFSHAGVSKVWYEKNFKEPIPKDAETFVSNINDLLYYQPFRFRFTIGPNMSVYGNDITQSPIWIRENSLMESKVEGYIHIIGHTSVFKINLTQMEKNILMIDILDQDNKYISINKHNKVRIRTIPKNTINSNETPKLYTL